MSAFDEKASEQSSQFDIDVIDHAIEGEGSSLEAHIFTLEIWLNQEPYHVRRSYKDICEFDVRLNKQYPKTALPPCPFSTSVASLQQGHGEKKGGINGIRSSIVALKNTNRRGSLNDMNPDISQKKPALLSYLKLLLAIPEIVRSTNMLDFLDMASSNGEGYEDVNINLLEMLLEGTPEKSVNIMKKHSVKFDVLAGQYIVWNFSTKKRDLGFSIDINDDNVLTYQRYNCHEQSISNVLKCPVDGLATLQWDNSYSKLRTKHLMFRCKVLSSDLYKEHSKKCVDLSREQQSNQSRRSALQRELVQQAHKQLASQSGRLISQDFTVDMTSGDKVVHEDLQVEICTLNEQKSSLQNALSESEIALADIRQELIVMKKNMEKNNALAEELERVVGERDELQQEILDECMAKKKLEIDLQALRGEMAANKEKYDMQVNQNQADALALATLQHQQTLLHEENSELLAELAQLKATERSGAGGSAGQDAMVQIQRLKGEKKQLKAYAISLKGQLESFEKEKEKMQLSDLNQQTALKLVQQMTPLLAALEEEMRDVQKLRELYQGRMEAGGNNGGKNNAVDKEKELELEARMASAVNSGKNTVESVSVMLEYAGMKLAAMDTTSTNSTGGSTSCGNTANSNESTPANDTPAAVCQVPDHTGSVYASMVLPPSPSSAPSSPMKSPKNSNNNHPATCNCMKCTAPPKRQSMMETVINTFLDVEESVDKKLSSVSSSIKRKPNDNKL